MKNTVGEKNYLFDTEIKGRVHIQKQKNMIFRILYRGIMVLVSLISIFFVALVTFYYCRADFVKNIQETRSVGKRTVSGSEDSRYPDMEDVQDIGSIEDIPGYDFIVGMFGKGIVDMEGMENLDITDIGNFNTDGNLDTEEKKGETYQVLASKLNIRKQPNSEAAKIGSLRKDDICLGTGKASEDGEWVEIYFADKTKHGWVSSSYLEKQEN